jgi:beta-mannosidase
VEVKVKERDGEFAVGLSSTTLVKNLYLRLDDADGIFSDNYFDLLPGAAKVVTFRPSRAMTAKMLERDLTLMHMALVV